MLADALAQSDRLLPAAGEALSGSTDVHASRGRALTPAGKSFAMAPLFFLPFGSGPAQARFCFASATCACVATMRTR